MSVYRSGGWQSPDRQLSYRWIEKKNSRCASAAAAAPRLLSNQQRQREPSPGSVQVQPLVFETWHLSCQEISKHLMNQSMQYYGCQECETVIGSHMTMIDSKPKYEPKYG